MYLAQHIQSCQLFKYSLAISFVLMSFFTSLATVITVDNNENSGALYSSIQVAIDAATVGDTIIVAGSETTYDGFTLNKKLVLIGAGYQSTEDAQFGFTTKVNHMVIKNENPALDLNASGSHIEGFYVNGVVTTAGGNYRYISVGFEGTESNTLTNVTFTRNRCESVHLSYFSNIKIYNNILDNIGYAPNYNSVYGDYPFGSNLLVANNIFTGGVARVKGSQIFINNLFIGSDQVYDVFFSGVGITNQASGIVFSNNILWGRGTGGASNVALTHNLVLTSEGGETFDYGTNSTGNNLENVNPKFVDVPEFALDFSYDYRLAEDSPCKGTGSDGTEMGIFGGPYPFPSAGDVPNVIVTESRIPKITDFNIRSAAVPVGSSIEIDLKARVSNNQ